MRVWTLRRIRIGGGRYSSAVGGLMNLLWLRVEPKMIAYV